MTMTLPTSLRVHLGASLQKHRLRRGMTQSQLAEAAGLSVKYVGEIERGEANTSFDVLERLASVVGWDPISSLEVAREPITEGVRVLLIDELRQTGVRLGEMGKWLVALDSVRLTAGVTPAVPTRGRARPHPRSRERGTGSAR